MYVFYGRLFSLTEVYQFLSAAKDQCEVLTSMAKKMSKLFQDIAVYFCFDPKKYTIEEFFGDIKAFVEGFKVSVT